MTAGMVKVPTIVPLRPPSTARKNMIDTATPIEILSDTAGAIIYYTVNGTKPEPFKKIGEKFTYRYYKPFMLGSGKRTVKALATTSDGTRESSIVTKMFFVEEAPPVYDNRDGVDDDAELYDHDRVTRENLSNSQKSMQNGWTSSGKKSVTLVDDSSPRRKVKSESRISRREEVQTPEYLSLLLDGSFGRSKKVQEAQYSKCIYCFAPRPSDPYSTFCNECGSPLPQMDTSRVPPPHSDKLAVCQVCHSMVPFNSPTCVVCEAAMTPQRLPPGSPRIQDKIVCDLCDTVNPVDMTRCVSCESKLPFKSKQMPSGVSAPPLPKDDEPLITCSKCYRVNSGEARFCDWCGTKPVPYASYLTCSRCQGNNQPYSNYCSTCACHIDPPPRIDRSYTDGVIGTVVEKERVLRTLSASSCASWVPVDVPRRSHDVVNQTTQTGGLFYPSSTTIGKQQKMLAEQKARDDHLRERKPSLFAISPGKGYWRQQMDHICSHLRAHAQNEPNFRALIGEPRIGKLVATTVHEDLEGEELTLTVTFTRRQNDNTASKTKLSKTDLTSKTKLHSVEETSGVDSVKKKIKRTPKKKANQKSAETKSKKNNNSNETRLLFKELGKNGDGSPEEVERLINEGADVNGENTDGVRVLTMAVVNNHTDCIPLLVNQGAEIDHQSTGKENTALHEAVLRGSNGRQCVQVLLRSGADTTVVNKTGDNAYDLAVKSGNESIIESFTSHLGQGLLDKFTKLKTSK